jgi:MFS family permease
MRTTTPRLVFTLAVLLAINTMNFFDRQTGSAVQEKIRKDWGLSDNQLGGLGAAFVGVYALAGLPLGWLVDVWRRKWVLALGVVVWSLMTMGSGLAWGFWSLFVLRLGVGIGEASCAPAANSLIGDLVPATRRARALSLFMLGLPLGLALSSWVSATIAQRHSWQAAFFVAGAPGLVLAVAALFLADPVRGAADAHGAAPAAAGLPFLAVIRRVLSLPTMWWIILSGALHNFNMYALGHWLLSLLHRYHGVGLERAGQITSLVQGFGALSIFAAGWLGDRAFRRGVSGRLHVAWIALAAALPCLWLALEAPQGEVWLCAGWVLAGYTLMYTYYGTVYASIQDIIEPPLRGMAMAIYFCAMYLLGGIYGTWATGGLSDYFARRAAATDGAATPSELHVAVGLHQAMYIVPILNAALVLVLFAASRTIKGDYERLHKRLEAAGQASK